MDSLSPLWGLLMSLPSSILIASFVGLLLIINAAHRLVRWHRLRHIPGPPLAGWTSLWLTSAYFRGGFLEDYEKLAAKYGPVIRVGPNRVLCSDVDTLYRISGVRSQYKKGEWYTMSKVSRSGEHTLSLLDPEPRRERKKYIGPAYSGRGGANFEEGADRALTAFIDLIERKYISKPGNLVPMDFNEKVHYWALDSIGEIAYSSSFGMLENDKDTYGILAANDGTIPLVKLLGNHVWVWRALRRWPLFYLLPNDGDESGFGAVLGHVKTLVTERHLPDAPVRRDMLQSFVSHGLQGEDLCQEVGIQFFAGSDTVASLVRVTLLLLLTHPAAYHRLQSELSTTTPNTDTEKSGIISETEARALPYLHAVIQEALRLFPTVAIGGFWKEVPREGDTVCGGVVLPRGTLVGTSKPVWITGREEGFWGGDGGCFRPERWIEEKDEARLAQMQRRVELAFGSGQFVCMGRAIALISTYKALAELLRRYHWSLVDPLKPPKLDNPVVWTVHDFWVRIEKR